MKKLSKKVKVQQDTIEVYACTCYCGCTCSCVPAYPTGTLSSGDYNVPFAILTRTAKQSMGG